MRIPEFIGRLPVIASLEQLDETALVEILTKPKNALVKQYKKMLELDDVELEFEDEALSEIAKKAIERKTGARGLRSIIEGIMLDVMFDLPSRDDIEKSLHADPDRFYPFFWGGRQERGEGLGEGYNFNIPLPRGTGDDDYLKALEPALARIDAFGADVVVIALGLDSHENDPLQGLSITTPGFARLGAAISTLNRPTLLVQEGGYLSEDLGHNIENFLKGFEGG